MKKQILFVQGGAGDEDHEADAKLVASLQNTLGDNYVIEYPRLPEGPEPDFGRMKQIEEAISKIESDVILVGHSLGASMLLKYLSEQQVRKKIMGIFLIATPDWSGDEDWKQGLKLQDNFGEKIPNNVPIYLYHSKDDESVPFDHLSIYQKKLPRATTRITRGGHQLNNDLSAVAEDIKGL